ncbi:hypothetical protein RJ640_004953 [Escallonia rubra]|uniref:PNO1 second type I KH domain-containing protein n=1 Tax=Escallonia rubra TaxID=112253 RepID=A0AA88QRU2_9ASTE|nr:hypothetical protein RJ640_004953 [Escallonia rubra]
MMQSSEGATPMEILGVPVPPHRLAPLTKAWAEICKVIYEEMKIDIRMNPKKHMVKMRLKADTPDAGNLQKCANFLSAFMLGFEVVDANALLFEDDIRVQSFAFENLQTAEGDTQLSDGLARLSGDGGREKLAIENFTETRIVIGDERLHILGSFTGIVIAREFISDVVKGLPAPNVESRQRAGLVKLIDLEQPSSAGIPAQAFVTLYSQAFAVDVNISMKLMCGTFRSCRQINGQLRVNSHFQVSNPKLLGQDEASSESPQFSQQSAGQTKIRRKATKKESFVSNDFSCTS